MRVDELIIEVRDPNLVRVGQFRPADLVGTKFLMRFNNVGSWEMKLPYGHPLGEQLRQPGYGIIVTGPNNEVILSGPTLGAKLEQTSNNLQGDWVIAGSDDSILLAERLAYPDPDNDDVATQTMPYDVREGFAESVIKAYVSDNLGPTAPATRQADNLTVETDQLRGSTVRGRARFNQVQELVYDLAQTGGIGYTIGQEGSDLVFKVYEPQDLSALIRLDLDNQRLSKTEFTYSAAKVTRAIVAGQGEAENRIFLEVTNTDATDAETEWGRRIEVFKDARNSEETDQLTQSGQELLVDLGKTIREISVTPSDDITMRFGIDWNLGDKVTVVANDTEAAAVVTEVGISIDGDGVRIGATVGTPIGIEFESKVIAKTNELDERIGSLERNVTGYGVNTPYTPEGGTDGTQPTFSGPAITGSFNRFGNMVHFNVAVDFDNITSFGTGQYYLTLPYPARIAYQFRDGCLHDISTGIDYHISGHVDAGDDVLWLFTTDIIGQRLSDFAFSQGEPITLTTEDNFHIAGTYEIEG